MSRGIYRWAEWPVVVVCLLIEAVLVVALVVGVRNYRFGLDHPRAQATVLNYDFPWENFRVVEVRFQPAAGPAQRARVSARYEFPPRVLPDPGGTIEITYRADRPSEARLPGYREAAVAGSALLVWTVVCLVGWWTLRERLHRPRPTGGRHGMPPGG